MGSTVHSLKPQKHPEAHVVSKIDPLLDYSRATDLPGRGKVAMMVRALVMVLFLS